MTDTLEPGFCHGEYSLYANAVRMGSSGGSSDTFAMFPAGWGQPGETRSGTIQNNAEAGLWLPLFIPEGCDGHQGATDPDTGELLPEVIFYASGVVAPMFDQQHGPVHASPEGDKARYDHAVALALEAAKGTSGSPYVRETP